MKLNVIAGFLCLILGFAGPALAVESATPDEAKAMAEKAAQYINTHGAEAAMAAFEAEGGEFHDRDLYVFMLNTEGTVVAHGANKNLVGRNLRAMKDVDGKDFIGEMLAVNGADWIDYKWQNPQTKAVEQKTSYVIRVDDTFIGVGAYKQ